MSTFSCLLDLTIQLTVIDYLLITLRTHLPPGIPVTGFIKFNNSPPFPVYSKRYLSIPLTFPPETSPKLIIVRQAIFHFHLRTLVTCSKTTDTDCELEQIGHIGPSSTGRTSCGRLILWLLPRMMAHLGIWMILIDSELLTLLSISVVAHALLQCISLQEPMWSRTSSSEENQKV